MGTIEHTYGRQYCADRACSRTAEHTGEHNYPAWMLPVPTETELLAAHVGTACSCQSIDRVPVGTPVGSAKSVPTLHAYGPCGLRSIPHTHCPSCGETSVMHNRADCGAWYAR